MFWRSIKNALETHQEPFNPDTSAAGGDLAHRIDAYYDSLLYEGMPFAEAGAVKEQRAAAQTGTWRRTRWRQRSVVGSDPAERDSLRTRRCPRRGPHLPTFCWLLCGIHHDGTFHKACYAILKEINQVQRCRNRVTLAGEPGQPAYGELLQARL
jgi:hypothetical protein